MYEVIDLLNGKHCNFEDNKPSRWMTRDNEERSFSKHQETINYVLQLFHMLWKVMLKYRTFTDVLMSLLCVFLSENNLKFVILSLPHCISFEDRSQVMHSDMIFAWCVRSNDRYYFPFCYRVN